MPLVGVVEILLIELILVGEPYIAIAGTEAALVIDLVGQCRICFVPVLGVDKVIFPFEEGPLQKIKDIFIRIM